ncbi:hypothetical protein [Saccharothrix syringae]|uniref:DUF4352 domain-containing protein n=1 Tax=Saccharothrix syringae TaxID=103733 RepID=A0A5Q0HAT3_SACSY|nr:hypothetical protein [Saccharothrix syringae]QFZ23358.1 hypothetical protein EKG83_43260 [Saccharothrix syringae]
MTSPQSIHEQYSPVPKPPKPSRFGALAWTALILGIVGVVGSPIIILNNLTAVAAGVGLVLGVIALFGTRKVLAVAGTALCVLAVVFTVMAQAAAVKELDEIIGGTTNEGRVGSGGTTAQTDAAQTPPTWGQRYTWRDGLAVEVSAPTTCAPGQYAAPQGVVRGAKVTVTIVNGTDKAFDTALLSLGDAQFDGRKAESVFDSNGPCGGGGFESTTVLPGKTYTYESAFSVGAQPGELQITLQPGFGDDKAVFVGQA